MTCTPNIAVARAFLQRVDPEADFVTVQTFDDTGAKRGALVKIVHIDPANGALESLAGLNAEGAGVYFTVNATDGKGRQAHNVQRVRAVFLDLDGTPLAPVLTAGLDPHIVVESSPGKYHVYWLTDDCPLDQFERVQRALARRFGGDPSVHDLPRVLRVPGFLHRKGTPFLVHTLDGIGFNGPPYALAEIVAALRLELDGSEAPPKTRRAGDGGRIEPGSRHDHLFAMGRSMARKGLSCEAVGAALAAENAARCDPPLAPTDVDYLAGRAFTAKNAQGWQDAPLREDRGADERFLHPGNDNVTAVDPDAWPVPLPLTAADEVTPYPLDALPSGIHEAVAEVVGFVQCPPALAACSALSALSLAGQALSDVQRADRLKGPTSLYLLAVAESGERKSTCDTLFLDSIREWESEQAERAKPDLAEHAARHAAWEERRAGIKGRIRQAALKGEYSDTPERELVSEEANCPQAPRVPRLVHADATPEALAWALAHGWPSGGVMSSEAGVVFGGHGMGRDSVMRNLSLLNALWDGTSHRVERRTSDSFTLAGVRLTMGLAAQPETVRQFMEGTKGLARGNGFAARFLIAAPPSTQGDRPFRDAPEWRCLPAFADRLRELLTLPVQPDDSGALTLPVLTLTEVARAAWVRFHDDVEAELRPGGDMAEVRDVASKAADNVARLAALFHVYAHGPGGQIDVGAVTAAARIVGWHLYQARAFLGDVAVPRELTAARRLDAWLVDFCRREGVCEVERRTIQNRGPNPVRGRSGLDAALAELAEAGRIVEVEDGRRKLVRVNPALLDRDHEPS